MRFLHPKWNPHLLAISVIELCLNCLPLRATETSNRVVVDAADVDLAKVQSGGKIVFVSSGQRPAAFHAIDCDLRQSTSRHSKRVMSCCGGQRRAIFVS